LNKESQSRTSQGHKSGAEGNTTNLTNNKDHIRTDRTDRELGFSDNTLDSTDCYKDCYKDSDSTGYAMDLINHAKLTDVQKRHISDRKDLYQETPQETPALQTTMSTMFCIPMPPPSTLRSLMFEGANVIEFLERYKDLCSNYWVLDKDRLTQLP
jgi:hypothetical protein